MPRRREVPKREILPDPKYGSVEITKFINVIMLDGKKAVAERIVYGALAQIEEKTGQSAIEVYPCIFIYAGVFFNPDSTYFSYR